MTAHPAQAQAQAQAQLSFKLRRKPRHPGGRPPRGPRSSERHEERPRFTRTTPLHIVIRTVPEVAGLRRRDVHRVFRHALYTTFRRSDFRICHISIQRDHVHLIVEADHHVALARGMQGFQISAAQHLNRAISRRAGAGAGARRGQVFADRYHATPLGSPTQTRRAIAYCLNNWRRHGADRGVPGRPRLDPYSSAAFFDGWRDRPRPPAIPVAADPLPIALPHTWMLSTGWRRAGLLSPTERPGPRPAAARER